MSQTLGCPNHAVPSTEKLGAVFWEVQDVSGARAGSAANWMTVEPPQLKSPMIAWHVKGNETKCVFGPATSTAALK